MSRKLLGNMGLREKLYLPLSLAPGRGAGTYPYDGQEAPKTHTIPGVCTLSSDCSRRILPHHDPVIGHCVTDIGYRIGISYPIPTCEPCRLAILSRNRFGGR
jgi:hypothetical protein